MSFIRSILRRVAKYPFLLYIKMHEKEYNGLRYLSFNRKSKVLAIVFSGFDIDDKRRVYNYVKSLSSIPIDFLFLSDCWGYRGSYYLFNNGSDSPRLIVQQVVNQYIDGGGYSEVITMGSSKGGTCALYYGLKNSVSQIIAGACQYRIGSYVSEYPEIFKGMTGNDVNKDDIARLDAVMSDSLRKYKGSPTKISLIHSQKEPTYERDEKYLIHDLDELGFNWKEYECGFEKHENIGGFFIPIAKKILTETRNKYK